MPNVLDANGLQIATFTELVTDYNTAVQSIYGADVNLGSDTPDGQWIANMSQTGADNLEFIAQVYASMDPDQAIGISLDQRVSVNGIQRQGGTFTITPITVVFAQSVNLYGLDQTDELVYTIADNAGNLWQLQETELGIGPGTSVLNFQAAIPGAQFTIPNTITVPVTVVLGVQSVNNPTSYSSLGVNEESDALLRLRRQQSVSLASQGYLAGLLAALLNIDGVTSAFIYENDTDSIDDDGVPGHTIWVIVAGTADPAEIANAIYVKRNAGCGMFGDESYIITQVDGSPFEVNWDDVQTVNLFIAFTASSINGVTEPNIGAIRTQLPTLFMPGVYEEVNINGLATLVQDIDSNTLVTDAGFSTGDMQVLTLSGIATTGTFKLNYNGNQTAAINWNDSIGTIQSKLQAVSGLSQALVTGSIASQTLAINLTDIGNVLGLIYVSDNSMFAGPTALTFAYDEDYGNTLLPGSKKYQFVISSENIIILPMLLSPSSATVVRDNSLQLYGYGGYGTLTYSFTTNNSGGTIDASTGLYEAGSVGSVVDVLKATDAFGNIAESTITVV